MKNDRQAMKILGLLENPDKKEVILFNFCLIFMSRICTANLIMNLDQSCECPFLFSD